MATRWARLAAAGLLVSVYYVAGFFPFELDPPRYVENAAVRPAGGGLRFPAPGIALTPRAPSWLPAVVRGADLRIRLRVRAIAAPQSGPARILTLSQDFHRRNLTIGQDGADLVLRLRRSGTDANGLPALRVAGVLGDLAWHDIALRIEGGSASLRVDGVQRARLDLGPDRLRGWDPGYRLALGNELIGGRHWLGGIAVADVEAAGAVHHYAGAGALALPAGWWRVPQRLHGVLGAGQVTRSGPGDVAVNLLGFVPLGAFLLWWRDGRGLLRALGVGMALSLSIEVGQVLFAGRYPSPSDLLLNTGGTGLGWLLGAAVSGRIRRGRASPGPG